MSSIELVLNRNSYAKLTEPAPIGEARQRIFQAALRAPDHAMLKPWQFLVVEGEARTQLGIAMAKAQKHWKPETNDIELEKIRNNPLRAPLVLIAVCKNIKHPKVPEIEQLMSTGCAIHQMLLAAEAEGFGGIWRTGLLTYQPELKEALSIDAEHQIVGFLYMGTPATSAKTLQDVSIDHYFEEWGGE